MTKKPGKRSRNYTMFGPILGPALRGGTNHLLNLGMALDTLHNLKKVPNHRDRIRIEIEIVPRSRQGRVGVIAKSREVSFGYLLLLWKKHMGNDFTCRDYKEYEMKLIRQWMRSQGRK